VHYWELGNEVDVDPTLVPVDYGFGCWGDISDPYYGGEHYGEMLKVVTPAIKAVDPDAKVMIGGLLLAKPNTTDPNQGKPELFLKGILEAGAAPYFDIVAYHTYPVYVGQNIDYDNEAYSAWLAWGGWTLGKARFLRATMAEYGVDKPLSLNETSLGCETRWYPQCESEPPDFFLAQANYVVRTFTRALSEDLHSLIWYTLDGPGWRYTALLDDNGNPRPAYVAYQQLIARLNRGKFEQAVDYGPNVEAYSFTKDNKRIHVVWSKDTITDKILVPKDKFQAAYNRDGGSILPSSADSNNYQFFVNFDPIYLELSK
jgi:hypothetical protein